MVVYRSAYATAADTTYLQPVPFSHEHHVGRLGIDCRYCHTSVEDSSFAGIPPTKTCMNCHSQIWVGSTMLEPVRDSYRTGKSIAVAARPQSARDFVYFDHSIHVAQGRRLRHVSRPGGPDAADVSGEHAADGVVPRMPSQPGDYVRPRAEVFNMHWQPARTRRR